MRGEQEEKGGEIFQEEGRVRDREDITIQKGKGWKEEKEKGDKEEEVERKETRSGRTERMEKTAEEKKDRQGRRNKKIGKNGKGIKVAVQNVTGVKNKNKEFQDSVKNIVENSLFHSSLLLLNVLPLPVFLLQLCIFFSFTPCPFFFLIYSSMISKHPALFLSLPSTIILFNPFLILPLPLFPNIHP